MVKEEDPQKLFFSCTRWVNGTWDSVIPPTCRPTEGSNPFLDNCPRSPLLGEMKSALIIQVTDYYTRKFSYTDFHLTAEAQVRLRSNALTDKVLQRTCSKTKSQPTKERENIPLSSTPTRLFKESEAIMPHSRSSFMWLFRQAAFTNSCNKCITPQAPHMDLQKPPDTYYAQYNSASSPYQVDS